jgi:hypothetical protein
MDAIRACWTRWSAFFSPPKREGPSPGCSRQSFRAPDAQWRNGNVRADGASYVRPSFTTYCSAIDFWLSRPRADFWGRFSFKSFREAERSHET